MDRKVDSRAMREVNRSIIYDLIRQGGQLSRTELARRSALTKPTVSTIVEELMAEDIVREVGFGKSEPTGGRRARLLEFNPDSAAYVGVRFGVRTFSVAVADGLGRVLEQRDVDSVQGDPQDAIELGRTTFIALLDELQIPRERVAAASVAVAGLVEADSGRCVLSPNLGWSDVPLRELCSSAWEVPVSVFNVTDAAATAELRCGATRAARHFVWVYCGTGIGAGVVAEGQLFQGRSGFAGEIGFCRTVADGPILEEIASGRAIVDGAVARAGESKAIAKLGSKPSVAHILELADAGDAVAQEVVRKAGEALGLTVAHLVNITNPEIVVLGGGVAERSDAFVSTVQKAVSTQALGPEVVPVVKTALPGQAVTRGAVLLAMDRAVQSHRIVSTGS